MAQAPSEFGIICTVSMRSNYKDEKGNIEKVEFIDLFDF